MPLLYERLRAHLLDQIRAGTLGPGDRIPSELALAAQFNVSRITSKKALETLEQEGVIVRFRGKGSFVSERALNGGSPDRATGHAHSSPDALAAQTIGFVFPDLSETFGVRMLRAIDDRAAHHNLQLAVRHTLGQGQLETDAIFRFVNAGVAGLIVFPVHGEYYNDQLLRIVLDGFPVVLIDRYLKGIAVSSVRTNNVEAASRLVDHLVAAGRRHLVLVSPPPERTSSIEDRRRGFNTGLRRHGLPVDQSTHLMSLASTLPGAEPEVEQAADVARIHAFLDAHPGRDGFVVVEYTLALLLEQVLRARGDAHLITAITCFDTLEVPLQPPRFTHVRQDERAMGRMAVDLLMARIAEPGDTEHIHIPFSIVTT